MARSSTPRPLNHIATFLATGTITIAYTNSVWAQAKFETELCNAAKSRNVVELVYDKDEEKGCLPRVVDVHQVAIGKNGKLYLHGYQHRGCAKKNDRPAERTFRFDKIQSVKITEAVFSGKSLEIKEKGWDGCLGNNCFIEKNICE